MANDLDAKHQRDFDAVLPRLDPSSRVWLRNALDLVQPGHPWFERLVW